MSCVIAYDNFADHGTVIAGSAASTLPASNLLTPHVAQIWRSLAMPTWLLADLDTSRSIDIVALIGVNGRAASTFRVRIGDDPDFVTANYDSGDLTDVCDPEFRQFVHLLAAPVAGRYLLIDLADDGIERFDAGRLFVSLGFRPAINFSFGAGRSVGSLSRRSQSKGGQIYTDVGAKFRRWNLTLGSLSDAEADVIERIDRVNNTDTDIFLCARVASTNLGKDTLFGTVQTATEINNRAFRLHSKPYVIEERR